MDQGAAEAFYGRAMEAYARGESLVGLMEGLTLSEIGRDMAVGRADTPAAAFLLRPHRQAAGTASLSGPWRDGISVM